MEEMAPPVRHARVPVSGRLSADRMTRFLPALFVLVTAALFTAAAVSTDMGIAYLAWDSRAYYDALRSADPYAEAGVGVIGSFLYPPPFLQVLAPAGRLPWPLFMFGWTALLAGAAMAMLLRVPRRYGAMVPALVFVAGADIWAGNINLLLAYAAILGLSSPVAWALPALTKVTPGVGALWLAFRGRWTAFAAALLVTSVMAAVSYLAAPNLWSDWVAVMRGEYAAGSYAASIPIPLLVRLPAAVLILWWAARTDRTWAVPVACLVALPVIWFNGLSLLLAAAALLETRPHPAGAEARRVSHPVAV